MDGEVAAITTPSSSASTGDSLRALIRVHDWAATPLGPPKGWPQSLRTLVNVMLGSAQPMFVAWGPERVMIYNDGYAPILGRRHPGALGRRFDEVWSDILDDVGLLMDQAYAGEPTHMDDIPLVMHRHGYPEETHFAFSYTPVCDEDEQVAGMFCACTETTDAVRARREREASEARLRGVLDGMTEGFVLLGPDFRVLDINAEGLSFETRPREEILGRVHWEVWPGTEESALGRLYKRAMIERVPVVIENHYVWPDGREGWFDVRAYPTADGGLAVFYRNVTERRRAEEALRASEEFTRRVLQSSADCIKVIDLDGRLECSAAIWMRFQRQSG